MSPEEQSARPPRPGRRGRRGLVIAAFLVLLIAVAIFGGFNSFYVAHAN